MRNVPVDLGGFSLMVTEAPQFKTRDGKDGAQEPVTDWQGVQQFVIFLFAKRRAEEGKTRGKGEEIKVTLEADPGEGFTEGSYVELVNPRVSPFQFKNDEDKIVSGISFKAAGMKPVG